jgi:L-threonylcarbamoyladenylate synthase
MSKWRIRQTVLALKQGNIIAYPTEAVFGLGCDPWHEHAVYSLLELKSRSWQKGLILVAANFEQLQDFVEPLSVDKMARIYASWPGPVTWILPAKEAVPDYLRGQHDTIAVRVTAHKQTATLCRQFGGAIVSTSANVTGQQPAKSIRQVHWQLPKVKTLLTGQCGDLDKPTQIRDGQTGAILR